MVDSAYSVLDRLRTSVPDLRGCGLVAVDRGADHELSAYCADNERTLTLVWTGRRHYVQLLRHVQAWIECGCGELYLAVDPPVFHR